MIKLLKLLKGKSLSTTTASASATKKTKNNKTNSSFKLRNFEETPEEIAKSLKARFGLTKESIEKLKNLTDMTQPEKAFSFTRAMKRKIICHLGPTNSGKTFAAIEVLKNSESGVYCAPLRLLAQEMYDKLNGAGVSCALRTGEITKLPKSSSEEKKNVLFDWNSAPVVSCTVEMLNLRKMYSVAVIDEIQMIADSQRGWAFTQALLGCNAERIYLCGEGAARPLIEKIAKETGESVEFVDFERLTPLELLPEALKNPIKYEAGDCVVTFSRKSIFKLKEEIEQQLKLKSSITKEQNVAVVYGSLPAENRSLQAAKFNDNESGVDILVASDAIGMGLNLNIKRIIFDRLQKFDGTGLVPVPAQQIRQIAGRAGRFNTKHEIGHVTCSKAEDYPILKAALRETEPEPYRQAGIAPVFEQIDRIRQEFADFDLADILDAFVAHSTLPKHYFLSEMRAVRKLLEVLRGIDLSGVNLEELFLFLSAPVKVENEQVASTFLFYANHFIVGKPCPVSIYTPDPSLRGKKNKLLEEAESAHKSLELYLWLNTRFPHYFPFRKQAEDKSEECCKIIDEVLSDLGQEPITTTYQGKDKLHSNRMGNFRLF